MKKMTTKTTTCPFCKRPLQGIETRRRVDSHQRRTPMRLPQPYTEQQLADIWSLLERRGTTAARLAYAIGEESGLRIGEITDLTLADVDLAGRRLFIRSRASTRPEPWVPYDEKTHAYLQIWLAERDATVEHDHLLHLPNGRPHTRRTLHNAMAKAICKTIGGRMVNEDGLASWRFHRLRCTLAVRLVSYGADAATVMSLGGWKPATSMGMLATVEYDVVARGYREAMARAAEHKSRPQTP
jgi:integrase